MSQGYTVMSHVWMETMSWAWLPLPLDFRKKGILLDHLQRCMAETESEWLWFDQVAMPQVFEEMDTAQKSQREQLRIDVISNFNTIYGRADKVM